MRANVNCGAGGAGGGGWQTHGRQNGKDKKWRKGI